MKIKDWKNLSRHPLSADYPDLIGNEWLSFVSKLRKHGIVGNRHITLHDSQILDGWQLYRACLETDTKPTFQELPEGIPPEEFVVLANDHRRHEGPEAIAARRERVAKRRAEGESTRSIAAAENVSQTTIVKDLAGEQGCSPENSERTSGEHPYSGEHQCSPETSKTQGKVQSVPRKVTGKDGKQYPARKATDDLNASGQLVDSLKKPVPPGLIPVFNKIKAFRQLLSQITKIGQEWDELKGAIILDIGPQEGIVDLRNFKETVRFACPYCVCPVCRGNAKTRLANCPCKNRGWLLEAGYKNLSAEYRE